ncbi:MAG: DUF373 family protein [Thermoplasmatota archaeon]
MKALIVCVDRDDDLGVKGRVATPVVGRRRVLDAALALGLADPEDSDTNALLAAIHLYDSEAAEGPGLVEVAAIAGHRLLGVRADRKLAAEFEEVLAVTRADTVILVSDGAEDEQILPILQSRAKVLHVHRSVVKQAPRLEGFYYVVTRLLDDPKQSRRFVLPVALLLLVWGIGWLAGVQNIVSGGILAFFGFWLLIHAMQWDAPVARFLSDVGGGLRSGRVTAFALLVSLAVVGWGADVAWHAPQAADSHLVRDLRFAQAFLPYAVVGLVVMTLANLLSSILRDGRTRLRHWTALLTLICVGFLGSVATDVAVAMAGGKGLVAAVTVPDVLVLILASFLAVSGGYVVRYVRAFQRESARARL